MISISWNQFERNQLAKDISFESFCYQIAYSLFRSGGIFENFYNTPGSEFYLKLATDIQEMDARRGDVIGWQVKWWFDSEDNTKLVQKRRSELIENFKTTLDREPNLSHWVICTPGKFTQDTFEKLVKELQAVKAGIKVTHWNKDWFIVQRTAHYQILEPIFHHYFNTFFIGFDQIEEYTNARIKYLHNKFDSELYASSSSDEQLMALIDLPASFRKIHTDARVLADVVTRIQRFMSFNPDDFKDYTPAHLHDCIKLRETSISTASAICTMVENGLDLNTCRHLRSKIERFGSEYDLLADKLNKEIKDGTHRVNGKAHDQIWQYKEDLIRPISEIRTEIFGNHSANDEELRDGLYDSLLKVFQHDAHIVSSAGYGKTNIVCNLCSTLLSKKWPALLLLGSAFRGHVLPQTKMLELLTWSGNYDFKQLLQAIDNLGFIKGIKVPIIIDGLNESVPFFEIWNMHISEMIEQVRKHEHVLLITTCRDMYIQRIFGVKDGNEVPNAIQLTGLKNRSLDTAVANYFKKYDIHPSTWHFNKELFQNPLLLKIFSLVNKNNIGITISIDNLYKSIDKYISDTINKASEVNLKVDITIRSRINAGVQSFCKLLWERGVREIPTLEFYKIIDSAARSDSENVAERLLDEGLCFQKNLAGTEETVQFTYDAVAGYCIASRCLMPLIELKNGKILNDELFSDLDKKIYSGTVDHPLRQDILIAQIHLIPEKFGVQLFEVSDKRQVLEEFCNNIDYIIDKPDTQEKLLRRIKNEGIESDLFRTLLEKLFFAIYKKQIHGLGKFAIAALMDLSQVEIDLLWTELFRKSRYAVEEVLFKMKRSYRWKKQYAQNPANDLYFSALASTSIDKEIRSQATEIFYLAACQQPSEAINVLKEIASFRDVNLVESCIAGICGMVLTSNSPDITKAVLAVLTNWFLKTVRHTHCNVIDYVETIFEYAQAVHNLRTPSEIAIKRSNFKPVSENSVLKRASAYSDYLDNFDIDLYDFEKYQISSISNEGYRKFSRYSNSECLAIIFNHFKSKGFNNAIRTRMNSLFVEPKERTWPRQLQGSAREYQQKYLWQCYYEFVGYLRLGNEIKSDDELPRYRNSYIVFDPTFPRLPGKFQLSTEVFVPKAKEEVQCWIEEQKTDYLTELYLHKLYTDTDWVLVDASVNQVDENNDTRWQLYINSFLIPTSKTESFTASLRKEDFHYNQNGLSFLFAGQIGWGQFAELNSDSYWLRKYNLEEMISEYAWSSWTGVRDEVPRFLFLNPKLARKLNLFFSVEQLAFMDSSGRQATRIVWSENQRFFYVRKDVIDELVRIKRKKIIWLEAVSKYGNWKRTGNIKLKPDRQNTYTIRSYPNLTNIQQTFSI